MLDYLYVIMAASVCVLGCFHINLRSVNRSLTRENTALKAQLSSLPDPPPSKELADFFKDMQVNGYGLIRVDPNDMFFRSPRSRG
jgi:hypothetical protein